MNPSRLFSEEGSRILSGTIRLRRGVIQSAYAAAHVCASAPGMLHTGASPVPDAEASPMGQKSQARNSSTKKTSAYGNSGSGFPPVPPKAPQVCPALRPEPSPTAFARSTSRCRQGTPAASANVQMEARAMRRQRNRALHRDQTPNSELANPFQPLP